MYPPLAVATKFNFFIPISSQPKGVDLWYFKLYTQIVKIWNIKYQMKIRTENTLNKFELGLKTRDVSTTYLESMIKDLPISTQQNYW